jgi:opacity protein-like surface antigen
MVTWLFGLLALGGPAGALELGGGAEWWTRSTTTVSPAGTMLIATAVAPTGEQAIARENRSKWGFRKGQQEVGLLVGYGFEIDSSGSSKSEMIKTLEFTLVRPRWGLFLTDRIGQGLLEGHLELLVEPAFLLSTTPTRRTGFELSVLFRYHFATGSRWVPFLSLGAGIIEENFEAGRPSSGFNFTPQGGPGVSYFLDRNMAVSLEWRLYHVSNANTEMPNVGLNISFLLLGFSIFF